MLGYIINPVLKKYLIWILIITFSLIYGIYSVVRHLRIETYIFDLGYYDQLIWLVSRGKPLYSSVLEAHPWSDHFSPSIFLLSPLYWLGGGAKTLVTFQAFFVCLGAYPIYLLAMKKTRNKLFSLTLVFTYLIFYGLQNAISFDFHAVTLGPTLLAFIFWFYDSIQENEGRKPKNELNAVMSSSYNKSYIKKLGGCLEEKNYEIAFWISLILFVGLQENFLVLAAALGIFIAVKYKDYKRGLFITFLSIVFLAALLFFIIPKYFGQSYYYLPSHIKNFNIPEMIKMLYSPSSKIDVVTFSFIAFGALPALYPPIFILLAEEFLGRFLGTTNSNWWILGFHYNAILAPIMAFGAIETVRKYFKKREIFAVIALLSGILISQLRVKTDIYKMFKVSYYNLSKTYDAKEVLRLIPSDASVAATNDLGAQIAHRDVLIFITDCIDKKIGYDKEPCYREKPDYYIANLDPNGASNNIYPEYTQSDVSDYLNYLLERKEYNLVIKKGYIYLLKKAG